MSKPTSLKPMSPVQRRFTQALLLSTACCCAWYCGVRPLEARADRARAELAAQTNRVAGGAATVAQQDGSKAKLLQVQRYLDVSKEWTMPAESPTELYDSLVQLAEVGSVRLDRIDPAGSPRPLSPVSATAGLQAGATGAQGRRGAIVTGAAGQLQRNAYSGELTGFRLGATGTFENIMRFIDAVQHQLGATRIGSMRIVASGTDMGQVELTLDTWHLRLIEPKVGASTGPSAGPAAQPGPPADGPPPLLPDGGPR